MSEAKEKKVVHPSILETLGNEKWMKDNTEKLKQLLPFQWTMIDQAIAVKLGFNFKLLNIIWTTQDEFGRIMAFLERIGLMHRKGMSIRANPDYVFDKNVSLKDEK